MLSESFATREEDRQLLAHHLLAQDKKNEQINANRFTLSTKSLRKGKLEDNIEGSRNEV